MKTRTNLQYCKISVQVSVCFSCSCVLQTKNYRSYQVHVNGMSCHKLGAVHQTVGPANLNNLALRWRAKLSAVPTLSGKHTTVQKKTLLFTFGNKPRCVRNCKYVKITILQLGLQRLVNIIDEVDYIVTKNESCRVVEMNC